MFKDDDPDFAEMYDRIQLVVIHGQMSIVSQEIRFRQRLKDDIIGVNP